MDEKLPVTDIRETNRQTNKKTHINERKRQTNRQRDRWKM